MGFAESWAALEVQVGETEGAEASAAVFIDGLLVELQTLRDQVANGNPITVEQIDAMTSRIKASEDSLSAKIANPA